MRIELGVTSATCGIIWPAAASARTTTRWVRRSLRNVGYVKARPETAMHSDFEVALLPGAVVARVNVVVVGEDP